MAAELEIEEVEDHWDPNEEGPQFHKTVKGFDAFLAARNGEPAEEGEPAPAKPAKAKPVAAKAPVAAQPETEDEGDEPVELEAAAEGEGEEGEATPEEPLTSFEQVAARYNLEPDTLLAQLLVDAPEGKRPLSKVLEEWRALPTVEGEIHHARATRQRYESAVGEFEKQTQPKFQEITRLSAALHREMGVDVDQLKTLEPLVASGDSEAGARYIALIQATQRRQQILGDVDRLIGEDTQRRMAEAQREKRDDLMEEMRQLQRKMPELVNGERATAFVEGVRSYLYGDTYKFSREEVGFLTDHRHLMIADKARRWDEMNANAVKGRKAAATKATPPASGRAPARTSATGAPAAKQQRVLAARKQLSQTGRVKDAARYFEEIL